MTRSRTAAKYNEVKHSGQQVPAQHRHLLDEEKCRLTERRFSQIAERTVLYRADDMQQANGVKYRNVEEYLQALSEGMPLVIEEKMGPDLGSVM